MHPELEVQFRIVKCQTRWTDFLASFKLTKKNHAKIPYAICLFYSYLSYCYWFHFWQQSYVRRSGIVGGGWGLGIGFSPKTSHGRFFKKLFRRDNIWLKRFWFGILIKTGSKVMKIRVLEDRKILTGFRDRTDFFTGNRDPILPLVGPFSW